jgi:hypothetical protein
VAAFALVFAGTLAVALIRAPRIFYYDSGVYWNLGETFFVHGHFSLLNFNSPLRGYLFPLMDHELQDMALAFGWRYSTAAKLFNVLMFSLIVGALAPRLAEVTWPEAHRWVGRRVALAAVLVFFWSGFLDFPLSDFPALAMSLLALVAIHRSESRPWMLVAGLACGAAIDMRPSYLLLAPLLVALAVWAWFEQPARVRSASMRRRALCLGLLLVGFALVSLPQSFATHRHFGSWSFVPGTVSHLTALQLSEGLHLQRYETYVGTGHAPQMLYIDEAGTRLLAQQRGGAVTGTGQYLGLIVSHPATMLGLFVRHIFNGIDQRYTTPYVEHLDNGSHRWLRLTNLLVIFLGLLRVLWPAARRRLGPGRWRYLVALGLCCLSAVPSAVETRYLLPIYLLAYVLVLAGGWPNPISTSRSGIRRFTTVATILAGYVIFTGIAWYVASGASKHLQFG